MRLPLPSGSRDDARATANKAMLHRWSRRSAYGLVPIVLAAMPKVPTSTTPPRSVTGELETVTSYVFDLLGWAAGISFVVIGGMFCWCYLDGSGTSKTMRALVSAATGCVLIAVSSILAKAVFS